MTLFRSILFAAVCLAVVLAPSASAQTQPFTIATYSGNGQMICTACPNARYQIFEPMTVQVLDANRKPVQGVQVNWFPISGSGVIPTTQTFTDANGLSQNTLNVPITPGNGNTPFITNKVTASVGNGNNQIATFYETQALVTDPTTQAVQEQIYFPPAGSPPPFVQGSAGSPVTPILVVAASSNKGTPGVEVRLLNNQTNPSISCATTAGPDTGTSADPGTAMTDNSGTATCNPVLSGSGSGSFRILVGGVAVSTYAEFTGLPIGYFETSNIQFSVTAATPGSIQVISGNNQTATAGQSLNSLLVATVKDVNGNPMIGQNVTWSVTPSNAGTFFSQTNQSDSNGKVQTGFTFSNSANGNATITVAIAGTNITQTFAVTAIPLVTVTSLTKVSGDSQTAVSGQAFANPLVVQVANSNGTTPGGTTVNFSVSGPVTLNTLTPQTNTAGQAQVIATASSVTAQTTATVTASIGSLTQTFTLTVMPPGPTLTANSFVNAADQKVGSLSPCSLATLSGQGVAPSVQGTLIGANFAAGPLTLAGNSINFGGTAAPIFSITNSNGTQSMTFQVPCEVNPSAGVPVIVTVGGGNATLNVPVLAASPGIYGSLNTDGIVRATLVRQDGSFVSLQNPARRGETVTAYVTGLGQTTPQVGTNQLPPRGVNATVNNTVVPGVAGGGATLNFAQLTPDLVGVYAVSFIVPANISPGNNVGFSIGVIPVGSNITQYSNLIFIPVQ